MDSNDNKKQNPSAFFQDFIEQVSNLSPKIHMDAEDEWEVYYRGLDDAGYDLLSPIGRYWESIRKHTIEAEFYIRKIFNNDKEAALAAEEKKYFKKEKKIFERFRHYGKPYLMRLGLDHENDWDLLALSRHHGLETRLMDWTTNPLVALYFAVSKSFNTDGIVYFVEPKIFDEKAHKYVARTYYLSSELAGTSPFDNFPAAYTESYLFFKPLNISERIVKQEAILLIQKDPREKIMVDNLQSIIIPKKEKPYVLKQLDMIGINERALFEGLDGIAKSLNIRMYQKYKGYKDRDRDEK